MAQLIDRVEPKSSAVIVIDMQNDYCHPSGVLGQKGLNMAPIIELAPKLSAFLDVARSAGVPVIHVRTVHNFYTNSEVWNSRPLSSDVCKPNSWGAEFYEVAPKEGEVVITKHRYNAFHHTPLESVLRALNIKNLLFTGVNTNVCVDTTARDGFMRDFYSTIISDMTETLTPGVKESTFRTFQDFFGMVVTAEEVSNIWSNAGLRV